MSFDNGRFHSERRLGLVGDTFSRADVIARLPGNSAIGHVRYSTTGETILRNVQPLFAELNAGGFAVGHNGNLTNGLTLRRDLVSSGAIMQSTTDTEVILHLVAKSTRNRFIDRFIDGLRQLEGAYAFVGVTNKKLVGARDPLGIRPLVLGKLDKPEKQRPPQSHKKIGFDVFDYGIIKRRVIDDRSEQDEDWSVGHPVVFPNFLKSGSVKRPVFQIRVPIDDHSCWVYVYSWNSDRPLTAEERQVVPGVPSVHSLVDGNWVPIRNRGNDYLLDRQAQKTETYTGIVGVSEQDAAIQDSQGAIQDRTREHLGPTDVGIVEFRKMVMAAARALQSGTPPKSAQAAKKYAVRAGGWMSRAETDFADVMTERFGHRHGYVGTEYGFGE